MIAYHKSNQKRTIFGQLIITLFCPRGVRGVGNYKAETNVTKKALSSCVRSGWSLFSYVGMMADGKKSFLVYCDLIYTVSKMTDEDAGLLLKHILAYTNDRNPEPPNTVVDLVFEPIKQQLKRDLKEYEDKCKKNKENIEKRWNKENTTVYDGIPPSTKHTDTDIDIDNDTDNDKKKNTAPSGATVSNKFTKPTLEQVQEYCDKRSNGIDAEAFLAHYDAVGRVYGKDRKPVKDWMACMRTREQKRKEEAKAKEPQTMEQRLDLRNKMGIKAFTEKYGNEKCKEITLHFF